MRLWSSSTPAESRALPPRADEIAHKINAAIALGQYHGRRAAPESALPSLRTFAQRYLDEDTSHLAPSTKQDRESSLREGGPLLGYFGDAKLDAITSAALREWWSQEIVGHRGADGKPAPLSTRTGCAFVDVLATVLGYARDLGRLTDNPIPAFREQLRRRSRTKGARAEAEQGRQVPRSRHPANSTAS
jgi:hypothetical protein